MQGAPTKCACKCNRDCVIEGCFATNMNNIKKICDVCIREKHENYSKEDFKNNIIPFLCHCNMCDCYKNVENEYVRCKKCIEKCKKKKK